MAFSFDGRRVLVTGGAGGLGTSVVQKFIKSGATVYAFDCNSELLQKLKLNIPQVVTVLGDLRNWDESRKIVEGLGPLDHLVNAAGIAEFLPILEFSEESFDRVMEINFKGAFNLSQVFCKNVIDNSVKGATIVNVSSIASVAHSDMLATYNCSKAALNMMTKAFAVEMGQHGIRVNSILPTSMMTNMVLNAPNQMGNKKADQFVSKSPLGAVLETDDAANLIIYLSSTLSQMITGTNIPIDGGVLSVL